MVDFIYHMTLKLIKTRTFGVKTSIFCHLFSNIIMDVIALPLVVYQFYCMVLFHSNTPRHVIKRFKSLVHFFDIFRE